MNQSSSVPHFWNDTVFRRLSNKAQLAYYFVISHPHFVSCGALRATLPGLAAELGWTLGALRRAVAELVACGLVRHAASLPFLWCPVWLHATPPASVSVVQSWGPLIGSFPDCPERDHWLAALSTQLQACGPEFSTAAPVEIQAAGDQMAGDEMVSNQVVRDQVASEEVPAGPAVETPSVTSSVTLPESPSPAPSAPSAPSAPLLQPAGTPIDRPETGPPSAAVPGPSRFEPAWLIIPKPLRNVRFLKAWSRWTHYCNAALPEFSTAQADQQLQQLAEVGAEEGTRIVEEMLRRAQEGLEPLTRDGVAA